LCSSGLIELTFCDISVFRGLFCALFIGTGHRDWDFGSRFRLEGGCRAEACSDTVHDWK
jgi:hypothetical protein